MNTNRLMHSRFASFSFASATSGRTGAISRGAAVRATTGLWRGVVALVDHPSAAPPA